ncbi:CYTH and CHAD domain-containing protein [Sphingomonas sp. MM-1]|uniref:CYTH and CHAD domain-containing protein n=1 Tax=Sphingomonas sp. MM-1 TaxID=745310 RepID=UPI000684F3EB|nr:CYTH and CHAD domain-containing protein [Sphingomonas sp. MM-1]
MEHRLMAGQEEVELKLDVDAAAMASFLALPMLRDAASREQHLHAIYYDTPDRDLGAAGASLRIRHGEGVPLQTLKLPGGSAAGLFARGEWSWPLAEDEEAALDEPPVRALLPGLDAGLAPLFEIRVVRRLHDVIHGDARIEASLDSGEISVAGASRAFDEVELELKSGSPAALFDLARLLDGIAPVRVGVSSKAERGYRLIAGRDAGPAKAEPLALADDATAAQAFGAAAGACLRQFRLNEPLVMADWHAGALHQARVALRRLRSTIALFRPMLADHLPAHLDGELRWLAGAMARARAIDVLIARHGDDMLRRSVLEQREAAYVAAIGALAGARSRALLLDLAEWISIGAWCRPLSDAPSDQADARAVIRHGLRRFRRRIKRAGPLDALDDAGRHKVRIAVKKLRYASDMFAPLFEGPHKARRDFLRALATLSDRLGVLNDIVTEPGLIADLGLPRPAGTGEPALRSAIGDAEDARLALLAIRPFWR